MATILVVDDEQPLRDLLADVLELAGHRVLVAANGREALTIARRDRPDLVVSDVMMPLLNGVRLCQQLKADPSTASVPVILMSSVGARIVNGSGTDAFVKKPFDLDEVEAIVRTLLLPDSRSDAVGNEPR
jgi:two-component system, OmpR family, alkaline phosphatase synthesis response regulator PhoP